MSGMVDEFSVDPVLVKFAKSFLENRVHRVKFGDHFSDFAPVLSGVSQRLSSRPFFSYFSLTLSPKSLSRYSNVFCLPMTAFD